MASNTIGTAPPQSSQRADASPTDSPVGAAAVPPEPAPPPKPAIATIRDGVDKPVPPPSSQAIHEEEEASRYFSSQRFVIAAQMSTAQGAQLRNIAGIVSEAVQSSTVEATESLIRLGLTPVEASLVSQAAARKAAKTATWVMMWGAARPGSELRAMQAAEQSVTRTVGKEAARFVPAALAGFDATAAAIGSAMAQPVSQAGARLTKIDKGFVRRFVPGLNVALVGWDAHKALQIQRDPKATLTQKVASWVTLAGSAVAATDLPIVSWIGIGVSVVGSFVRDNPDPIAGLDSLVSSIAGQFTPTAPAP